METTTQTLTPLRFHGPGWELETEFVNFILWAWRPDRLYWSAGWERWNEPVDDRDDYAEQVDADHKRAATLGEVLQAFDQWPDVRAEFRRVANLWAADGDQLAHLSTDKDPTL